MRPEYHWPNGSRSGVLFSIDVDAESPYIWSTRGKPSTNLAELEQRRFGPRQGLHSLIALLKEFDFPATFFVPAWVAETYQELLPGISGNGFEVGAHGFYHELVNELSLAENASLLDRQISTIKQQIGMKPAGYRAPAWELSPAVHSLLIEKGFLYNSSLMGFEHPYSLNGLVEIPVDWTNDDGVYFRYVYPSSSPSRLPDPAAVLNGWIEGFEASREASGLFTITVHDWISGRGQRIRMLRKLLEHIRNTDDVWIATAEAIAKYHLNSINRGSFDEQVRLANDVVQI